MSSGAVLLQPKDAKSLNGLPTYRWTVFTPRGDLTREGLSNLV